MQADLLDREALDAIHFQLMAGQIETAMDKLVRRMRSHRSNQTRDRWEEFVSKTVMSHPIRAFIHRDPCTRRSFSRPLGLADDAVMLDMLSRGAVDEVDPVARSLFAFIANRPLAQAIRNRTQTMADQIEETVKRHPDARILALAAGHLRELDRVRSVNGAICGQIIALDPDAECLATVEHDYAGRGVRTLHAPVEHFMDGLFDDLCNFDLVYAPGLISYLPEAVAATLCEKMFAALKPGGRMLLANFVPDIPDVGYMESFMDWHLVYRDEAAMLALVDGLPWDRIDKMQTWHDDTRNIVFLSVERREK
jgi:SAM-dependent methyltransferase